MFERSVECGMDLSMTCSPFEFVKWLRLESLSICSAPISTKVGRSDLSGRVDPLKINVFALIQDKFPDGFLFAVLNLLPTAD